MRLITPTALAAGLLAFATLAPAQTPPLAPDFTGSFVAPSDSNDYVKRVEMVPMRDGVRLYTVIVIPRGASHAPILLTRTPYNAAGRTARSDSAHMAGLLAQA